MTAFFRWIAMGAVLLAACGAAPSSLPPGGDDEPPAATAPPEEPTSTPRTSATSRTGGVPDSENEISDPVLSGTVTSGPPLTAVLNELPVLTVNNAAQLRRLGALATAGGWVFNIAISPDSQWLALERDREVQLWDLVAKTLVQAFPKSGNTRSGLAFSPDSRLLACIGASAVIQVIDVHSGEIVAQPDHRMVDRDVYVGSFSPDGRWVVFHQQSNATGSSLFLWDLERNVLQSADAFSFLSNASSTVLFHPVRERTLIVPDSLSSLRLWEIGSDYWKVLNTPKGNGRPVISPDGRWLAYGGVDGTIFVFDENDTAASWQTDRYVYAIALSPDAGVLAAVHNTNELTLWDVQAQTLLGQSPTDKTTDTLAVAPNGQFLVTGGSEGGAVFWGFGP